MINHSLPPIPVCVVFPNVLFLAPTLISSLSLNHHLYVDETQIFFSFYAPDFLSNIHYLLNALQHITSCMTANLLTLNTSKTEFLLNGLKQQLAKIQNCTLNTNNSARNLGFIFDDISLSLNKYLHYPNPAILTYVNFAVSAPILIPK